MTAAGELVCEGLSSGTYRVINAEEADATCDVDASGDAFECTVYPKPYTLNPKP